MKIWRWKKASIAGCIFCMAVHMAAHGATRQVLVYDIEHSRYGEVGTYRNTIEADGGVTTVKTDGQIEVSFMGIVAYRQSINRLEQWQENRLTYFDGVTIENGTKTEVKGEREGNNFVV